MFPFWNFSADVAMAGFEAQQVIALRMLKLAGGGRSAETEARLMVSEKMAASAEAATSLAMGGSPDAVLKRYRTLMRANTRRLTRQRK